MGLIIGSHVGMSGKQMLVGSVKEALSYKANTFMFYTGAPQNTRRKPISELRVDEAKALMQENGIDMDHVVVHAPYIINLGNTIKPETYELAVDFLAQEIERVDEIGAKILVLHPGAHVKGGIEAGLDSIVKGLNTVLKQDQGCTIALETMAGKGTELGDAGYDINDFDSILDEVDAKVGLGRVKVIHVNDSKNPRGAHKDRHENIGYGTIGFDALNKVVHNPRLENVPKILETPYIDDVAPYGEEIDMFRKQVFNPHLKETIIK